MQSAVEIIEEMSGKNSIVDRVSDLLMFLKCVVKFHCLVMSLHCGFYLTLVCWSSIVVIWMWFMPEVDSIASFTMTKMYEDDTSWEICIVILFTIFQVIVSRSTSLPIYRSMLNGWAENAVPFRSWTGTRITQCLSAHTKQEGEIKSWSLT